MRRGPAGATMTPLDEAVERAIFLLTLNGEDYLAAVLFAHYYSGPLIPQERPQ